MSKDVNLDGLRTGERDHRHQTIPDVRLTDEARGETARLLRLIEPDVQAARRRVFKVDRALFESGEIARKWIETESSRQTKNGRTQAWKLYEMAVRVWGELEKLTGRECRPEPPILAYYQ